MKKIALFVLIFSLILGLGMPKSFAQAAAPSVTSDFTIVSPNGAPGLVLATLAKETPENFRYCPAETIPAEFAKAQSDFIIAPINAGAKLYKSGKSAYKLAAVVTWGNLYIASQKKDFTLQDIKNSGITLFGEKTINSVLVLFALEKNNIIPKNVEYLAGAANTQALLLSDPNAIVLTAEPALSAASAKNSAIKSYSVNELYKKATGFEGFPQAGLFVRSETLKNHPAQVQAFLKLAKEAAQKCTSDIPSLAKAAVELGLLPNEKIAEKSIPNCAVRYLPALEAKEAIETTAKIDISQFGGSFPDESFYYSGE